jgi:hypothetical protein
MNRLDPTPDTWHAWRTHLSGQATTVALASGRASSDAPANEAAGATWSGPAVVPTGLSTGRFATGAGPLRHGWLTLDADGLVWAPTDGTEAISVAWDDVSTAEVAKAWWRSRAGVRLHCGDQGELWFDALRAEGLEKALEGAAAR